MNPKTSPACPRMLPAGLESVLFVEEMAGAVSCSQPRVLTSWLCQHWEQACSARSIQEGCCRQDWWDLWRRQLPWEHMKPPIYHVRGSTANRAIREVEEPLLSCAERSRGTRPPPVHRPEQPHISADVLSHALQPLEHPKQRGPKGIWACQRPAERKDLISDENRCDLISQQSQYPRSLYRFCAMVWGHNHHS